MGTLQLIDGFHDLTLVIQHEIRIVHIVSVKAKVLNGSYKIRINDCTESFR